MSKNKVKTEAVERQALVVAPAKAKGLTKKRGRKDRFTAEANTNRRAANRLATHNRRVDRHREHLLDWAHRNGVRHIESYSEARDAVRERRLMTRAK